MQALQAGASLVGRILLATIFLVSGYGKLTAAAGTQKFMADAGLPMVPVLYVLTVIVELGGGVLLVVGWKARIPAFVLFLFLIPVTLTFHTRFSEPMQMANFLKNLAIMGGLLTVVAHGPGTISVDGQTRRGRLGDRR
jgi:putative oxidoreductase